jgi:hypothetical protein
VVVLNVTLVVDRVQVRPVIGETVAASAIVPVKPSRLVTITVVEPLEPARTVVFGGLVTRLKLWTV